MVAHIELPAIDPEKQPATFSPKVISTLLRPGFDGLIYSDSMKMDGDHQDGLARRCRGARREGRHRRDSRFAGLRRGGRGDRRRGEGGRHSARAGGSSRRGASSKPRRGSGCIARARSISKRCRCRSAAASTMRWRARSASDRSRWSRTRAISVPLPTPRTGSVLYLSVLDYPSGWRIAAPSRDDDSGAEGALAEDRGGRDFGSHHAGGARSGARDGRRLRRASSPAFSCAPRPAAAASIWRRRWCGCCRICRATASGGRSRSWRCSSAIPTRRCSCRRLPAMLLTYDFSDYAEQSAVKAMRVRYRLAASCRSPCLGFFLLATGSFATSPRGNWRAVHALQSRSSPAR